MVEVVSQAVWVTGQLADLMLAGARSEAAGEGSRKVDNARLLVGFQDLARRFRKAWELSQQQTGDTRQKRIRFRF